MKGFITWLDRGRVNDLGTIYTMTNERNCHITSRGRKTLVGRSKVYIILNLCSNSFTLLVENCIFASGETYRVHTSGIEDTRLKPRKRLRERLLFISAPKQETRGRKEGC